MSRATPVMFVHGALPLIMGHPAVELRALPILPLSPVSTNMPRLAGDCCHFPRHAASARPKLSPDSYSVRVVLLAEAVATMPWLVTLTDWTTSPAGSCGMAMVIALPDSWLNSAAKPLAELSVMAILLGLVCLTVPVTLPTTPRLTLTAFGPAAGSAVIVAAPPGTSVATEENGRIACPLMWSTVAPVNEELRCTPVALAVTLN